MFIVLRVGILDCICASKSDGNNSYLYSTLGVGFLWNYNGRGSNFEQKYGSFGGDITMNMSLDRVIKNVALCINVVPFKFTKCPFRLGINFISIDILRFWEGGFGSAVVSGTINNIKVALGWSFYANLIGNK